jgi:hypothetical protein
MANIRRNQNLKSVLSNVRDRIDSLEGARGFAITGSTVSSISTSGPDDENPTAADLPASADKRYQFKRVLKAYIYGSKVTGNTPRLELYFGEDPEIAQADFVNIQGINGTSTDDFGISPKSFRVYAIDSLPWDDDVRATQPWRNTPSVGNNGETITHTVWINPVVEVPITYSSTSGRELITTRRIDAVSATGSTVTVTLNSSHLFKVGDVVSVDLEDQLFGIDGLFVVATVPNNTSITYELDTPLASSISLTGTALGTKYVYPVARNYVPDGQVWIDTSVEPNRVWVWNTLRWYDTAEPIGDVAAVQDGVAPSPVTSLTGDSELPAGSTSPVINLSWTPPTTRSNAESISGFLDGYDIWYKRSSDVLWKKEFVKNAGQAISDHQIKDAILLQNVTYNIRVYTVDIMGQYSTAATVNVLTAKYSEVLNPPSKPAVSSRLGTITVTWDGNDSTANLPVPGVLYVEIHQSTTTGFTPSSSTLVTTVPNNIGGDYAVLSDLTYSQNYYFKLVFVRQISPTELESSDPSAESDAIQVAKLVNTDIIANTISGANIQSGTITASDKIIGNTITGALIQALTIEAGNIKANAITATKIEAGAITSKIVTGDVIQTATSGARVELRNTGIYAYDSGNNPVLSFNTSTSTLLIGGYATDSELSSGLNSKVSGTFNGTSWVTAITGNSINSGVITGIVLRTAASGQRLELQNSTMDIYDNSGFVGQIYGGTALGTRGVLITGNNVVVQSAFSAGTVTSSFGSFGELVGGVKLTVDSIKRQNNGQLTFTTTAGTTVAYVDTSATGSTDVQFWVVGRVSAVSYVTRSSRRFKTNIQTYSDPLEAVLNLNVVTYQMDPAAMAPTGEGDPDPVLGPTEVGLIAEEVAEAGLSSIVAFNSEDESIAEGIDYSRIGVLLIPIVKQLRQELNDLKNRVDNL